MMISIALLASCAPALEVKEPQMAGRFYPESEAALGSFIDKLLRQTDQRAVDGRIIALISPHAAYTYSGYVAAAGYKQLKGRNIKTVVMVGESHNMNLGGASIYVKGSFRTPLGLVPIDSRLTDRLLNVNLNITFRPEAYENEHTLEVQLPFLQKVLAPGFKIVPILVSNPSDEAMQWLVQRLMDIVGGDETVIIVSSTDLSHYHDYRTANKMDSFLLEAICKVSHTEVEKLTSSGSSEMCGNFATELTLTVAERLGANYGLVFMYANSGDFMPNRLSVVGYASIGLIKGAYSVDEQTEILSLARKTIEDYVIKGQTDHMEPKSDKLKPNGAAFVTIKKNGVLRGCMGQIDPVVPLYQSIEKSAVDAVSKDLRFPPMTKDELDGMEIEVSIISPLEKIFDPFMDIEIGKHGVYLLKDGHHAIFLPEIPIEEGWDIPTLLKRLSMKAGLPKDGWMTGAELYRFTTQRIVERPKRK